MCAALGTFNYMHKQGRTLSLSHPHAQQTPSYLPSSLNLYWLRLGQEHTPLAAAQHTGRLKSTSQARAHTETTALSRAKKQTETTSSELKAGEQCVSAYLFIVCNEPARLADSRHLIEAAKSYHESGHREMGGGGIFKADLLLETVGYKYKKTGNKVAF